VTASQGHPEHLTGPYSEEIVIVVPIDALSAIGLHQGFNPDPGPILAEVFRPGVARGMLRSRAERDPCFKQLIGYVILRHGEKIFHYRRSRGGSETRLAGQRSVGLGGHLNLEDVATSIDPASLERSIRRELAEEVNLIETPTLTPRGILSDDTTEVGRVHLGVVILVHVPDTAVLLRDPTLADGRFDPISGLVGLEREFEGWSRLCLGWLQGESENVIRQEPS
jgi:predicted NUDIX family phosphoesterase